MHSDESQLRHPAERPLFLAFAVLNVLLMAAAVFIVLSDSDWLRAHPHLAGYIRVLAIGAVFGIPAIVFLRNTRHALVRGKSIALSPQQLRSTRSSSGIVRGLASTRCRNCTSRI
jgi:hypothetical protein